MMENFDDEDYVPGNNNIDFEAYHELNDRCVEVYFLLKEERRLLDEEMSDFSEERIMTTIKNMFGLGENKTERKEFNPT